MKKEAYNGPLERVDPCCVRIPKSYKSGMLVDGMIFADDRLLDQIRKDQAADQVANVAFLPGIQGHSLAMPDIHWGYGFCIGGVAATDPAEGGVISPGGIGYDINCLTGDSRIRHRHGYTRRIDEFANDWRTSEIACHDLNEGVRTSTTLANWFGKKPDHPVLELTTISGDTIRATADHPFWTPHGMKKLGELREGDLVGMNPFEGVPYEKPTNDVIVDEDTIRETYARLGKSTDGNAVSQTCKYLRERGLLPLWYDSPSLPVLCKVAGFVFGDGSLHFDVNGKGITSFYGEGADLESIRSELATIGVTASRIYSRERQHAITTTYKDYEFQRTEEFCRVTSTGFAVLLASLGVPVGKKPSQNYDAPAWLDAAPRWQKRLFLAGYFGAELTTPATISGHDKVFAAPVVSLNKSPDTVESGERFFRKLSAWLAEFGVETQNVGTREEKVNAAGKVSVRLRLILSPKAESQLALWSSVGFEFNRHRSRQAGLAIQYLKRQQLVRAERAKIASEIATTTGDERNPTRLIEKYGDRGINRRFVERALYEPSETSQRIPTSFPTFSTFCEEASHEKDHAELVWDRVGSIRTVTDFDGLVYDFTVDHDDHNFVANGFVVSNCGVRLVKTNLFLDDVKPHLRELIKSLFYTVPSGVGKTGKYKFDPKETRRLMGEGPKFVVARDLGVLRDLEYTEANGFIADGDPDMVTDHAVKRGAEQCGTLGSGNHFMEVQVVDAVLDGEVAKVFGLELNQVCVMIHSGSRGLGYQVCDDGLSAFRNLDKKYGINLPDRQLACAPAESPEGRKYIQAMRAAANYGFCNRQLLMQQAREVFAHVFGRSWQDLDMYQLYDVAHNIAKLEEHTVNGKLKKVWVHRKGATRAFPAGHPEVPEQFRHVGQPVIIPGDMGRASWVLVGAPGSMAKTFGTTCHGAGRAMSRTAAVKASMGKRIDKELESRGVIAMASSRNGLAEEQPNAYKNVDHVVDVVHEADLSRKVARMRPIGVIKG
jgi:tRNA-splicing ligase RtcB (3'-phosphate/5'-hydroxy nucleic acid ligase)